MYGPAKRPRTALMTRFASWPFAHSLPQKIKHNMRISERLCALVCELDRRSRWGGARAESATAVGTKDYAGSWLVSKTIPDPPLCAPKISRLWLNRHVWSPRNERA